MKILNSFLIVSVLLLVVFSSGIPVFAAEEESSIMCDVFTMLMPSRQPLQAASWKAPFSVTTSWRAFLLAPGWFPMLRSLKIFHRATTLLHRVSIGGRAATGSCFLGSWAGGKRLAALAGRECHCLAAGNS